MLSRYFRESKDQLNQSKTQICPLIKRVRTPIKFARITIWHQILKFYLFDLNFGLVIAKYTA